METQPVTKFEQLEEHLGPGRTLYTKSRGVKFKAYVAGGMLVIDSDNSGISRYTPQQAQAAIDAIEASAPPLADRGVQVARSWVGAALDSMAGTPNPAKPKKVAPPAKGRAQAKAPAGKTPAGKAGAPKAAAKPGAKSPALAKAPVSKGKAAVPGKAAPSRVVTPKADAAVIAREIGREIAKAIANGVKPEAPAIESVVLEGLRADADAAAAEVKQLRANLEDAEARRAKAEKQFDDLRSRKLDATGFHVIVFPGPKVPGDDLSALLRQAAASCRTSPHGSVATSRSALEVLMRLVAARIPAGDNYAQAAFASVHGFLMGNQNSPGNLVESDLFLAKDLYRRSSAAGHGDKGWKATESEALLLLAGVWALAEHAQIEPE